MSLLEEKSKEIMDRLMLCPCEEHAGAFIITREDAEVIIRRSLEWSRKTAPEHKIKELAKKLVFQFSFKPPELRAQHISPWLNGHMPHIIEQDTKADKMNIYVASSWRNKMQPAIVTALRKLGHEVYDFRNPESGNHGFNWSEIDGGWIHWTLDQYVDALEHEIAKDGFNFDMNGLLACDALVLLLPCGRSAHLEAGWAKGAGKKLYILMMEKEEPELMYKMADRIFTTFDDFLREFEKLATVPQ